MTYLRIRNFWEYQNKDVWAKALAAKKSERRFPPWCKLYVNRDDGLDAQPAEVRLLFFELLRLAVTYVNAIPNDSELIAKRISMRPQQVTKGLLVLRNGGWIHETKSNRPSRDFLEGISPKKQKEEAEEEAAKAVPPNPPTTVEDILPMRSWAGLLLNMNGERASELERLAESLVGEDDKSRDVLASVAAGVELSVISDLRERAGQSATKGDRKGYGWAINALKGEQRRTA